MEKTIRQTMRAFASALCLAAAAAVLPAPAWAADEAPTISAEELAKKTESASKPVLLDVREPGEFAAGHLPGAINIPLAEVEKRASEIKAAGSEVVVYCQRGGRARKAEATLAEQGISSVHLDGGMAAWVQAGKPVEKPAAK
jgi:rhodanese-related sulfurtransferase